jgi:hypothetical protein
MISPHGVVSKQPFYGDSLALGVMIDLTGTGRNEPLCTVEEWGEDVWRLGMLGGKPAGMTGQVGTGEKTLSGPNILATEDIGNDPLGGMEGQTPAL